MNCEETMILNNAIEKITGYFSYSIASIKNRYPCKIIGIKQNNNSSNVKNEIVYQAVNKINIRKSTAKDIISDSMLIEKFHPTDGVKLGFISAGEILFDDPALTLDEIKILHRKIVEDMFKEYK